MYVIKWHNKKFTFAARCDMEVKRTKCICGICTSRCIIEAEVREGSCKLCLRGVRGADYAYRPDRILSPLHRVGQRGSGEFEEISWEEAIALISEKLLSLRESHGADSVAFYSGYSKWYRPMLRRLAASFGSVNYGTESSACHRSAIMANMCNTGFKSAPDYENAGVMLSFARARLPTAAAVGTLRNMPTCTCAPDRVPTPLLPPDWPGNCFWAAAQTPNIWQNTSTAGRTTAPMWTPSLPKRWHLSPACLPGR